MPQKYRPHACTILRAAFCIKASNLLPQSAEMIGARAIALFGEGTVHDGVRQLRERLEHRLKYWQALAGPYRFALAGCTLPDGRLDDRALKVLREARSLGTQTEIFQIAADGVAVTWPGGGCRIRRWVFLPPKADDHRNGTLLLDPDLINSGGLFVVEKLANGYRLLPFSKTVSHWRLLLRMARTLKSAAWTETRRRYRAGQRFIYEEAGRDEYRAILNPGRMPAEVKSRFTEAERRFRSRLERLNDYHLWLQSEGRRLAEEFAAEPGVLEIARANDLADALRELSTARTAVMEAWKEYCYKDQLPAVAPLEMPLRAPIAKRSLSHRQRARLDRAESGFSAAVARAKGLGWISKPAVVEVIADRRGQCLLFEN